MNRQRSRKTKINPRPAPNRESTTMTAALVLDVRQLEMRIRDLTKPLSLRQASPSRFVLTEEPSPSSSPEVHDRIQRFFEAPLGEAGPDNEELESIRYKRIVLEESQVSLEQELKQVRRKTRNEVCGLAPVHSGGQRNNQPCTNCNKLEIGNTSLEARELALQEKERELQAKLQVSTMYEKQVQEQKRQIEVSRAELAAERVKFQWSKSAGGEVRSGTDEGSLAQREVALIRQKHKVIAACNQQQAQLRTLEASRKALQEERRLLEAARQQERQTRTLQQQFNNSEKVSFLLQKQEIEVEIIRLKEERNELNSERRALEAQRRELNNVQMQLANQNTSTPNKCPFPFCCFSCWT